MPVRKFFVSFTGLLIALDKEKVDNNDLAVGLFRFRTDREHVMKPGEDGRYNEVESIFHRDLGRGVRIHQRLAGAVLIAETEGRVSWRTLEDEATHPYKPYSDFLEKMGYGPIAWEDDRRNVNAFDSYCHPGLHDRIMERNILLEVVM